MVINLSANQQVALDGRPASATMDLNLRYWLRAAAL
jgi:hypothetical protein